MNLDLDKEDLISLVNGTNPSYDVMNNEMIAIHGCYSGSYGTWEWNKYSLCNCSEKQLIDIYYLCKSSWGK